MSLPCSILGEEYRRLQCGDDTAPLMKKAFDVLLTLVRRHGPMMLKVDLMDEAKTYRFSDDLERGKMLPPNKSNWDAS